jgi:Zn-dependent M28 family amino/carboxypeptidase
MNAELENSVIRMNQVARRSLVLLAATAVAAPLSAQTAADRAAQAVDSGSYRAHLEFLSSDLLEGRGTATRGGALAALYIATQFQRLGLQPMGDSGTWFQQVPIIALTPEPLLRTTKPVDRTYRYRDDYVLWSMRNDTLVTLSAEAVYVGYGIVAPEYKWDDYAGVDVHGKIVVCLVNDPGLQDSTIFEGKILTYYGRWTYKIEEAARHGAAGILMVHTAESATYPWSAVSSSWTGEQVRLEKPATSLLAAGWLQDTTAASIFHDAGQDLDRLTALAATRQFKPVPLGVTVDLTVRSSIRRSSTVNVVARLAGQGPHAAEAILIGGHYDHFGIREPVKGDSIFNGALDNASGTAAVIALAEAFVRSGVRPGRSLLFTAFGAEESGLLGSEAMAARPPIPLREFAAVLNLDEMNLFGRTTDISALGVNQSSLGATFTQAAKVEGLKVTENPSAALRGSFFRSDHFPFAKAGVPSLSLEFGHDVIGKPAGWGAEQFDQYTAERYHQPGDEILPWYTVAGAVQQLRVVARTAIAVGAAAAEPTWNPGSAFYAAGQERLK